MALACFLPTDGQPSKSDNVAEWAAKKVISRIAEDVSLEGLDQTQRSRLVGYCKLTIQAAFHIYLSALAGDPETELRKAVGELSYFEDDSALPDKIVRLVQERMAAVRETTTNSNIVHSACFHRPNVAACGANQTGVKLSRRDAEITCPECKPIALGTLLLAAVMTRAGGIAVTDVEKRHEAHYRVDRYVEAFHAGGRLPPQWLFEWIGDLAFLDHMLDVAGTSKPRVVNDELSVIHDGIKAMLKHPATERAVSILSDMADASESAAIKAAMKLAAKRIKG